MNRLWTLIWLLAGLLPSTASASPNRYALIIGMDAGASQTQSLPPLKHAQRDAARLRERLLKHARFTPERVEIVQGGGRSAVLAAAERLSQVHRSDRQTLGDRKTLFAFFFTGHGLEGQLLTADAPLSAGDLRAIFRQMDATLAFGFVDACHSGSVALRAKGAVPIGFNPVRAMPEQQLSARGMIWLVSSRTTEVSYEDPQIGGLFTHYFLEAFTQVPPDRFGVSLEAMWGYARQHAAEHAGRHGRTQTPQKIVSDLDATGPIYFSVSPRRPARLDIGPELSGEFRIAYRDDTLIEVARKQPGQWLQVPIHPGSVEVTQVGGGGWALDVEAGTHVLLTRQGVQNGARAPGYRTDTLGVKGGISAALHRPTSNVYVGAGWSGVQADSTLALPLHRVQVGLDWVSGGWTAGADFSHGSRDFALSTWRYALRSHAMSLRAGHGWGRGAFRADLLAAVHLDHSRIEYDRAPTQTAFTPGVSAGLRGWWTFAPLAIRAQIGAQAGRGRSAAVTAQPRAFVVPQAQVDLVFSAW